MSSSVPPPRREADDPPSETSKLAHDLRGPLSVIRAHVRMLTEGMRGPLAEEQTRSIQAIDRQATRLARIADELDQTVQSAGVDPGTLSGVFPTSSLAAPPILIADDDEEILHFLGELLGGRYKVTFARDGGEALAAMRSQPFYLAIVDLQLPVLDGFAVAEAIRASSERQPPAFMFLSAQASPQTKVRALSLGAADYVTKPFDPDELVARIARIVASEMREASLRADALTDPLTGLANYRSLSQGLAREIERSRRYGQPLSLLTLDLDHLKAINDAHGHDAGNEAIQLVARALKGAVRSFELVARQGGDEFAVLLPNTTGSDARLLAERLRGEIAAQEVRGEKLSASIGVASRDSSADLDTTALVKASDEALYRAKRAGRDRVESASTQ
jgi:diguanylate cyclase (GGDEF)-like protein